MKTRVLRTIVSALTLLLVSTATLFAADKAISADEAKAIAKKAYIYGLPMVLNYKTMYQYTIDSDSPEYKGTFNTLGCQARLYTPDDKAVVTPNSDTPYCMAWGDLRAEPIVLTIPEMEPDRFYEVQLIDLFTHNYAYVSTIENGNVPGRYLLTGPDWHGKTPPGISKVIPSETQFIFAVVRTQLFSADDLKNVKKLQEQYGFEPLSTYLGTKPPKAAPVLDFPKWKEGSQFNVDAFKYLDFMLGLVSTPKDEAALMRQFERIGVGRDETFDINAFAPKVQAAIAEGVKEGLQEIETFISKATKDPLLSAKTFGTRDFLIKSAKTNYGLNDFYLIRAEAAHLGLYGNSGKEAIYPTYLVDSEGMPMNAAKNNYTLTFKKGEFPPVTAFWSLTMYDGKTQLLVKNPLNRYLLNSSMVKQFKYAKDGSVTLYLQHESPGKALEPNWLPAPDGPFYVVMRLYGPEEKALSGSWKNPPMIKTAGNTE